MKSLVKYFFLFKNIEFLIFNKHIQISNNSANKNFTPWIQNLKKMNFYLKSNKKLKFKNLNFYFFFY